MLSQPIALIKRFIFRNRRLEQDEGNTDPDCSDYPTFLQCTSSFICPYSSPRVSIGAQRPEQGKLSSQSTISTTELINHTVITEIQIGDQANLHYHALPSLISLSSQHCLYRFPQPLAHILHIFIRQFRMQW